MMNTYSNDVAFTRSVKNKLSNRNLTNFNLFVQIRHWHKLKKYRNRFQAIIIEIYPN